MAKSKVATKNLSVLIVCPLAVGENRLHDLTWQSIQNLVWSQPLDILLMRDDAPDSPHMQNLTDKMNRARTVFLQGTYDAMLLIESDMVVPSIALQRLARVKADVAYGVYCNRHTSHRWLAYAALERSGEGPVARPDKWGTVLETHGVGFGCTLIHRRALEAFEFRAGPDDAGADWNFAVDLVAGGYRQAHDFGVLCGHAMSRADSHRVVWPIEDAPYYAIVDLDADARKALADHATDGLYIARKVLTSFTTGKEVLPGETIELPAALAADFLQRKIVDVYQGEL